mmetsp:Transcript_23592/g.42628  ORF Transcript_23592/g.42628 Transcript_23592/m.42628 type:complete len:263 (+) Transcript_23592:391-1179(+)
MNGIAAMYSAVLSTAPRIENATKLVKLVKFVNASIDRFFRRAGVTFIPATVQQVPKPTMKLRMPSMLILRCSRIQICPRSLMFLPSIMVCKLTIVTIFCSAGDPFLYICRNPNGLEPERAFIRSNFVLFSFLRLSGRMVRLAVSPARPAAIKARKVNRSRPDKRLSKAPSTVGAVMIAKPMTAPIFELFTASSCPWNESRIRAVPMTVPEKVVKINRNVFENCSSATCPGKVQLRIPEVICAKGPSVKNNFLPKESESFPPN